MRGSVVGKDSKNRIVVQILKGDICVVKNKKLIDHRLKVSFPFVDFNPRYQSISYGLYGLSELIV